MALLGDTQRSAREWVEQDRRYRLQGRATEPLVLERADGMHVWDVSGNRYMDFESGQFGMATGHGHPEVMAAAHGQLEKLMHHSVRVLNIPRVLLAERLAEITPGELSVSYFGCSGSEANEAALRLAKRVTARFEVVAVLRDYHGRSSGSASVSTGTPRDRTGYGPGLPGVAFLPAPYPYRCPFGSCRQTGCNLACFEHGVECVDRTTTGEPAAVIVEFVSGRDIIPVPENWAKAVRAFCDERGALLVADEALTGVGRTGKWFACEHYGVTPDILATSKGLGGGIPLCAVITTPDIAEKAAHVDHDQTASHMGDPFQCAVAFANVDVIDRHGLVQHAERQGAKLIAGLKEIQKDYECIGEVRGIGLLVGVEIVTDRESQKPAPDVAAKITAECQERGLLLCGNVRVSGRAGRNLLRLAPPLIISDDELDTALQIIADAVAAATR